MENTTRHTIDLQGNEYEQRTRLVLVGLPAFYVAVLAATIIDGILGRSLMAFWSLLLVMTWPFVRNSWNVLEGPMSVGGIPASFALKTLIPAFCVLLLIQGLATIIRSALRLAAEGEAEAVE